MTGGWCSILVRNFAAKTGLKIRQGHIDEVSGAGRRRPVGGWCWGLRQRGDLQGHAGVDPFTAETQVRGKSICSDYGLGLNLQPVNTYYRCSVACLEVERGGNGYRGGRS